MPELVTLFLFLILLITFSISIIISDGFWHGQSPGKRICGLMVVYLVNNKPCSIVKSTIRNLFSKGLILPVGLLLVMLYGLSSEVVVVFLALVSAPLVMTTLFNNRGQHLGDIIAKTQVIERKDYKPDRYY